MIDWIKVMLHCLIHWHRTGEYWETKDGKLGWQNYKIWCQDCKYKWKDF